MTSARTAGTIEASASDVWKYVGNFAAIDQFVPPIARSIGTGSGVPTRCELEWIADFDAQGMPAPEVAAMLEGVFQMGIDTLRQKTAKA